MKVLVIDDHPLVAEALGQLLPQVETDVVLCAAGDPVAAVEFLDNEPDIALILLDLALPGARGFDFLADLILDYPGIPIVVLSATHDDATVNAALAAGARGFIPKTVHSSVLIEGVRDALQGARVVRLQTATPASGDGVAIGSHALGLTPRQVDVLKLLVEGKPNKIICRDLRLSEGTVKVHVSAILRALRVQSRTQAVAELARRGIHSAAISARR
ncbi:MAG: response regulator transcription factor [Casimicrobiaceae bacterium]